MPDLLLLCGIVFIVGSFWVQRKKTEQELREFDQMKQELDQAKKDVNSLMQELTEVSEQVVETVSNKIKDAHITVNTLGENSSEVIDDIENYKNKERKTESLDTNNKIINLMTSRQKEKEVRKDSENSHKKEPRKISIVERKDYNPLPAKHQAVYSLSELGYSVEQIAKQLSIGKGEVSLILQLKQKGEEVNGLW